MPQFDQSIIFLEICWLILMFLLFYFYLTLSSKVLFFRTSFFTKWWLSNFIKLSHQLSVNSLLSSKCYVENVYWNYLRTPQLTSFSANYYYSFITIKQLFLITNRHDVHMLIKKYVCN